MHPEKLKFTTNTDWVINYNELFSNMNIGDEIASGILFNLKEDLFQMSYQDYTLDVGWYPEFDINGSYKVLLIKAHDWSNPINEFISRDICIIKSLLNDIMSEGIESFRKYFR